MENRVQYTYQFYNNKVFQTLCLTLICVVLNGCGNPTQITEVLVKAEEALKGNLEGRKEKLFGGEEGNRDNDDPLSKIKYDESKLTEDQKKLLATIISSNPEEEILKDGSFCNEILFNDTSQKLIRTLKGSGYGQEFSFKIGVTAMPKGSPGNMMWRELWRVQTARGVVNYPMVFIEDGVGGAFFLGLQPYNEASNATASIQTTKEDMTPNFFNSIKPLLSKNNSKGKIKHTILYFSASWCGPCQQFTPMLAQWYMKTKAKHPEMEIVFVSSDRSKEEFESYAKKMPWAHLSFENKDSPKVRGHAAQGIPFLMLINEKGTALTEKKHPNEVLPQIESFITGSDITGEGIKMGVFN